MRILFHLGAHSTDEGRILDCLSQNRGRLWRAGTLLPEPATYRPLLREAMAQRREEMASAALESELLGRICGEEMPQRLILSNDSFLSAAARVFKQRTLYGQAGDKVVQLQQLFPGHEAGFCLAIRNPATFIPAVVARLGGTGVDELLGGIDARALRWSDVVKAIAGAAPGKPLTVWCNEDTPLIWPEVLAAVAGQPAEPPFEGQEDFLASLMTEAGVERMRAYLRTHVPAGALQRRRVVAAFLDKFARPEAVEEELDVPGWTEAVVEEITESYEEDIFEIQRMPEVTFLEA